MRDRQKIITLGQIEPDIKIHELLPGYLCAENTDNMPQKKIIYAHLAVLLLFLLNIIIATTTGYSLRSGILFAASVGYYITLIGCFFYVKSINRSLIQRMGKAIGYVIAVSSILLVELLAVCITALFVFVVLVFDLSAPVKSKGMGYEIRLQPAFAWPPRYVLFKANTLFEKRMGDTHLNEDDFKLKGDILNVAPVKDSVRVTVKNFGEDTGIVFKK